MSNFMLSKACLKEGWYTSMKSETGTEQIKEKRSFRAVSFLMCLDIRRNPMNFVAKWLLHWRQCSSAAAVWLQSLCLSAYLPQLSFTVSRPFTQHDQHVSHCLSLVLLNLVLSIQGRSLFCVAEPCVLDNERKCLLRQQAQTWPQFDSLGLALQEFCPFSMMRLSFVHAFLILFVCKDPCQNRKYYCIWF